VSTQKGLAPQAEALLQSAEALAARHGPTVFGSNTTLPHPFSIGASAAVQIYRGCMKRWRIRERFRQPDWSILDLWVARHLLAQGMPANQIANILRFASPHFPRGHGDPEDYLRRTITRAAFSPRGGSVWDYHHGSASVAGYAGQGLFTRHGTLMEQSAAQRPP